MIPPSHRLLVVGVNHRTAPLALREGLAFGAEQAGRALGRLRERFAGSEAVIVSTCNRVEIYVGSGAAGSPTAAAAVSPTVQDITRFLAEFHGADAESLAGHVYHHEGRAMVEHLFAVASSLDSMVVGETQILGQVRGAYQQACEGGAAGKVFHALFQRALAAAKDVHERTNLSAGRLSIASVAVDVARSVFDRFDDKTVVCVGAGKMAGLMLRHLQGLEPGKLIVTNRSPARAQKAAAEFAAQVRGFEELDALLVEADILLTSTGAERPIITEGQFRGLLKARRYRPIVVVDIAVPRDVEAGIGDLANVYLYNIDDLQEVAAGNRGRREEEIAASRVLLAEHVEGFLRWFAARDVGPVVKALYDRCHGIARAELEGVLKRNPEMSAAERAELERMTHRLVGKILHGPVARLTSAGAGAGEEDVTAGLSAALKRLFELGEADEAMRLDGAKGDGESQSHTEGRTESHRD